MGKRVVFFREKAGNKWTPKEGDTISSLIGVLPGETLLEAQRNGQLNYEFTPSNLRTYYTVNDLTVSFSELRLFIGPPEAGKGEGEFELEQGWIAILRIAGSVFISPTPNPTVFTLKTTATGTFKTFGQNTQQLQLQQEIRVAPGTLIQLEVVPFIKVLRVIKETTVEESVAEGERAIALTGKESGPEVPYVIFSRAIMVYSQEF